MSAGPERHIGASVGPDSAPLTDTAAVGAEWDALAPWWKRTSTDGADIEYARQILPIIDAELSPCSSLLDLGCGEGQVARRISQANPATRVVGVDPSECQLHNAMVEEDRRAREHPEARQAIPFARSVGEHLPFRDGCFDAIVCCLAIEHAVDVDALLGEVGRVLHAGGQFLLLINHPLYQGEGSGLIDDTILDERYWRVGPYLAEKVSVEEVDRGVFIPFAHRPLSRYVNPLAQRGLFLVKMLEPAPIPEFLVSSIDPAFEATMPRLMVMSFIRFG